MDSSAALIVTVSAVAVSIYLLRRDRKERAACARTLRREVAELDLRWPVTDASTVAGLEQARPETLRQVRQSNRGTEIAREQL